MSDHGQAAPSGRRAKVVAVALALVVVTAAAVVGVALVVWQYREPPLDLSVLETGDLVFVRLDADHDAKSLAYLLPEGPNHAGFAVVDPRSGAVEVLEAWKHVKLTPLDEFMARAQGSQVWVKRFIPELATKVPQAVGWGKAQIMYPYDRDYSWDTEYRYYNAELLFKALDNGAVYPRPELKPMAAYAQGRPGMPPSLQVVPEGTLLVLVDVLFNAPELRTVTQGPVPEDLVEHYRGRTAGQGGK